MADPLGLSFGQRVRIRMDPSFSGPWPAEPLGTIVPWPTKEGELFVLVDHAWGQQRAYFVRFDEPQLDTDGLGPYYKAEVWERYIEADVGEDNRAGDPLAPVVLNERGDVNVFASIKRLVGYIEAIDVREGAFEAFDAVGRPIVLAAASDRAPVTYALGTKADPRRLREILVRFVVRSPRPALTEPQAASLEDLLAALLPRKP